jgi:hypothetical protein
VLGWLVNGGENWEMEDAEREVVSSLIGNPISCLLSGNSFGD